MLDNTLFESPLEVSSLEELIKNPFTNHDLLDNVEVTFDETRGIPRYKLPPRSTRGIPPKRYDFVYEAQRSKYPVTRASERNLSQISTSFNASLTSTEFPKTVEEAIKNEKWKKAMEEEINALHGRRVHCLKGRK